ncbi:GINS complex protein-domain-containing protein [Rhypophila decipiens]|uniref:DNA replication complex GINS protein PSF2 n=1 Tax=Rhypophila decipiens TaxID=261697 RepID=A0AAN7B5R3_9PEZI|nr:GINS complex protein-domain-containing protein [Rhypophila decipiens]
MAHPLPPGLTPAEVAFLAEMEMVTIVPRQRIESIDLLGGKTPTLRPPHRAQVPLWLALLLKKQNRANIVPPPWLHPASLQSIIQREKVEDPVAFSPPPPPPSRIKIGGTAERINDASDGVSPPFLPSCTADAPSGFLPYHWQEVAEALLAHAGDDMPASAGEVRGLLRDLAEIRAAKLRSSSSAFEGFGDAGVSLTGVGAMELADNRAFLLGVIDGVRTLGAGAEATRREQEEEERAERGDEFNDSDEEMGI